MLSSSGANPLPALPTRPSPTVCGPFRNAHPVAIRPFLVLRQGGNNGRGQQEKKKKLGKRKKTMDETLFWPNQITRGMTGVLCTTLCLTAHLDQLPRLAIMPLRRGCLCKSCVKKRFPNLTPLPGTCEPFPHLLCSRSQPTMMVPSPSSTAMRGPPLLRGSGVGGCIPNLASCDRRDLQCQGPRGKTGEGYATGSVEKDWPR